MAELPEFIGKYKIESLVARGGMGAVLKAMHPTLNRHVVLKKLTIRGSSAIAERFKREARILIEFQHDNVVRVFDHFKEGSSHYMVLEYVDGLSLDQLLKKQRFLSSELSLAIFADACKALRYAHRKGVIHRDIKPGNILMSKKGEVKLADFGIAASEDDADSALTREGMTLGTPSYMPPEQIENAKNVDKRADIYAMGVMLYEMVTGKKPYPANFSAETVLMIRKGRYRRPRKINARVHPFVERLIARLIQPDPARRFQDMDEVIKRVERYLSRFNAQAIEQGLCGLLQGSLQEEPSYPRARRRGWILPTLAILLAGLGAGGSWLWSEGYGYRWAFPDRAGELRVSVRVAKADKPAGDLYLLARIYADDGSGYPELPQSPIHLALQATEDADPYYSFESKALFLQPGAYRLKLIAGSSVLWESFTLASLASSGGRGGMRLHYRLEENRTRPLAVQARAKDARSGLAIDKPLRVSVLAGGLWTPLEELPEGWLQSGGVRQFRVEAEGYQSETFSLRVAADQDNLILAATLESISN
jgi:serine/threonine-protein kinase